MIRRKVSKQRITHQDWQDITNRISKPGYNKRHRLWITLASVCGLRKKEIACLTKEDITNPLTGNIANTIIPRFAKLGSQMRIKLSDEIKTMLQPYTNKAKYYLFVARGWTGKGRRKRAHVHPHTIYRAWIRLQKKLWGQDKYSFHDLRRLAISRVYESSGINKAKRFARHKRANTTKIYIIPEVDNG